MIYDNDTNNYILRVYYDKQVCAKWLSKFEIAKYFECAIRRADFPYIINVENHSRIVLSFDWEKDSITDTKLNWFDIQISDFVDPEQCLSCLQKVCVSFLMPVKCQYV